MSVSTIISIVSGIAKVSYSIYNYATSSKEPDPNEELLQEMLAMLYKLEQGQTDILAMLDVLLSTTEWRAHEEIVIDAFQNIDHRYSQLIGFRDNVDFDTEEGRTSWANTVIDEMSSALSDIDHAIKGDTSPTLNPLVTEFKNYFTALKESAGYEYQADQQVVLRYLLFLLNKQSQAYSVFFNARDILGTGHDDLDPETVLTDQYTLVETDVLKALTSFWQTPSIERKNDFVPLWPPDETCPVDEFALGEQTCSAGKVAIGVRFKVYSNKVAGLEMCEAAVGPLGIPKEPGTWVEANQSVKQFHTSSSTNGFYQNYFKYDDTVDVGETVEVLTGLHLMADVQDGQCGSGCYYTRAQFTQMTVATGELVAGTERWETQPIDEDAKDGYDLETLDGLPSVDGATCITGLAISDFDKIFRINALKTLRVATV